MAKRKQPKSIEIIELSSDSEDEDVPQPSPPNVVTEETSQTADAAYEEEDQPLLRIKGIQYNTEPEEEPPKLSQTNAPAPAKLPVRAKSTPGKDTGSTRHRHVSIEIALPTSSLRATKRKALATEIPDSEEEKEEVSIYKTPMDRGKHITFDDSDNDEYLTPMEHPAGNTLEIAPPKATDGAKVDLDAVEEEQEDEEDSDDEAPEAVSSHAAGAQQAKSSRAATNAAKQYVHYDAESPAPLPC
jgi:U3 small nucleolar RNA-associated protein 16